MDTVKAEYLRKNGYLEVRDGYKYVKTYNNNIMFYTKEYLDRLSIDEIGEKDKENTDHFSQF